MSEIAQVRPPFGGDVQSVGTVSSASGISVSEGGDDINHVTTLTLTDFAVGSATGAAALAFGALLYTLPAGIQIIEAVHVNVALTGTAPIIADTPDVGIGSVIASGVVSVLGGTATFEDYITGQTSGAIDGTNYILTMLPATAGALSGIALNKDADVKAMYLNCADTWAAAGDVTATGTIKIVWKKVS